MKLSKIDIKIMYQIHKEKIGLSCYRIAKTLNIDVAYVHRRLKRLLKQNVLIIVNSTPALYYINNKEKKGFINQSVECPKCHSVYIVHYEQTTKVCENPECKTKSGKQTRFYIYDKRVTKYEKILT